jgi:hypothetical protein
MVFEQGQSNRDGQISPWRHLPRILSDMPHIFPSLTSETVTAIDGEKLPVAEPVVVLELCEVGTDSALEIEPTVDAFAEDPRSSNFTNEI